LSQLAEAARDTFISKYLVDAALMADFIGDFSELCGPTPQRAQHLGQSIWTHDHQRNRADQQQFGEGDAEHALRLPRVQASGNAALSSSPGPVGRLGQRHGGRKGQRLARS
jgi:hypothetical protein